MIVDCHAHVFTHWIGACGHPTREVHRRYLQRVVTRTVAPTFRLRDGTRADTKALFRAGDEGWTGLADVNFRVGRFGQLEFTHEGFELSAIQAWIRAYCGRESVRSGESVGGGAVRGSD